MDPTFTRPPLNLQKKKNWGKKECFQVPLPAFFLNLLPEVGEILGNLLFHSTALTQAFKKLHLKRSMNLAEENPPEGPSHMTVNFIHSHFRHLIQTNCRRLVCSLENSALTLI